MKIIMETVLIVIGSESDSASTEEGSLIDSWLATGRCAFFVNRTNPSHVRIPPGTHGYVFEWKTPVECLFFASPILYELTRRSCKRLLFMGPDWEGSIETNLRAATSLGFLSYLYDNKGSEFDGFRERISPYSTVLSHAEILEDIIYAPERALTYPPIVKSIP